MLFILALPLNARDSKLTFGHDAPDFSLVDQNGYSHSLMSHRGKFVLVFFYPRAQGWASYRKAKIVDTIFQELLDKNIIVYGISMDSNENHLQFQKENHLGFDLLSDPTASTIQAYHADGLFEVKSMSYLIGPDGRIFRTYDKIDDKSFPQKILNDLSQL